MYSINSVSIHDYNMALTNRQILVDYKWNDKLAMTNPIIPGYSYHFADDDSSQR